MNDALLRVLLIAIALITIVSGLSQMVMGSFVYGIVATTAEPAAIHLFATVGMFMFITGAMFLQSLLARSNEPAIPLWIGVQKLAAAVLVTIAWSKGYFVAVTLLIAAFDAVSGVLAFIFWKRLSR